MTFLKRITGAVALGVTLLVGPDLSVLPAQAGYVVTLEQVGSNVVATGSGPIDLTGLRFFTSATQTSGMVPQSGVLATGPTSQPLVDLYEGRIVPRIGFGGTVTIASSGSGDIVSINVAGGLLGVPAGYVSGSPLLNTSIYNDETLNTLQVFPGTYQWTWGPRPNQNFTLVIPAAVPEPASLALLGAALVGLVLVIARRRSLDAG